jgi:hypothetical protein
MRSCFFSGQSRQTLDFSRFARLGGQTINKVIHTIEGKNPNVFQIKDLGGFSEINLNTQR